MWRFLFVLFSWTCSIANGQDLTQEAYAERDPLFEIGAYLDVFHGYDFNKPPTSQRLYFLTQHNRHNETNLNHGILSLHVTDEKYRARLALHSGTYVNDNYAAEPEILRNVYHANVGVSLNSENTLWLDAGIFGGSWIGFQHTQIINNDVLGHNIISETTPYYMAGIMASYEHGDNWTFGVLLNNGWQRIKRVDGSSFPNLGTQVTYGNDVVEVNWSTFIGTDDPDITRRMRYFNHFYGTWQINDKWRTKLGFDIGLQQTSKGSSTLNQWWGMSAVAQYQINTKWAAAGRYEFYSDPNEVIVTSPNTTVGFETSGISVNADYWLRQHLLTRVELRQFFSNDAIFPKENTLTSNSWSIMAAIVLELWKEVK